MLDVNILFVVIIVYILLYSLIIFFKPSIIYDRNKNLRQFGVGYKNTTILPLWLVSILLAIISYFIVLYVLHLKYNTIFIKINPMN